MAENSLAGQVALITGASRGLGRSLATLLVGRGVRVALVARASSALDETAAELGEAALACPCDIRSPEQVRAAIAHAAAHFGRLDMLINNAAACLVNAIETLPDSDMRAELETNFMAPVWCVREAIPHLRASGNGHILNISSESVGVPFPFLSIYAATKAALETFSTGLREELRKDNIRVSVLRSGHMTTSVVDQWSDTQKEAFFSNYVGTDRAQQAGAPLDPLVTARTLVHILAMPPEANVRIIELGGR